MVKILLAAMSSKFEVFCQTITFIIVTLLSWMDEVFSFQLINGTNMFIAQLHDFIFNTSFEFIFDTVPYKTRIYCKIQKDKKWAETITYVICEGK